MREPRPGAVRPGAGDGTGSRGTLPCIAVRSARSAPARRASRLMGTGGVRSPPVLRVRPSFWTSPPFRRGRGPPLRGWGGAMARHGHEAVDEGHSGIRGRAAQPLDARAGAPGRPGRIAEEVSSRRPVPDRVGGSARARSSGGVRLACVRTAHRSDERDWLAASVRLLRCGAAAGQGRSAAPASASRRVPREPAPGGLRHARSGRWRRPADLRGLLSVGRAAEDHPRDNPPGPQEIMCTISCTVLR